ncbi:probable ATP-dependent DNA helicase HFM1 isoform X1 [Anastrepha obliqua]|uniref:probable ATP-dependent DNA helicase HFM1 isoform X1 n=2 Tax=Anastrepha obliqua TaxID=95512 RepID=UPI002409E79B|nr:probable ATP-dependent DNA helicase HFM1 isoform X1 [Anastrepha obliqua]
MDIKTFADIPSPFGRIFEHLHSFNAVQSSLIDVLLHSNRSVVLSAPTGSGKTVAFELAIVRMLLDHQLTGATSASQDLSNIMVTKAIYVAPIKALCAERFDDWKVRFGLIGVKCLLLTGDSELDELTRLRSAQVIITTPEKWDSLTRHWRDCRDVISSVRLFLIDEVHLLNEDVRGPVLEAVVSRMHTIARDTMEKPLRFVVASATIPNVQDITRWIAGAGASQSYSNKRAIDEQVTQLVYSDSDRPVPLERHVLGFNSCMRGFKFDMTLNYKLTGILQKYSDRKATLIFCNCRKSAEMAAAVLEKNVSTHFPLSDQQKENLAQLAQNLHDTKLRKLTAHGIAYHHAGMSLSDRHQIEDSFRQGNLIVLLCTNTLAMGVNLPARLVIIKSTEYYHLGQMTEYPESTLLQMIGRAGRPQYDTKGVAVILTHSRNVHKYETLMNGKMPIESHLHKHLAEHLNSEIALGTINNLEVAMKWMRSTYFYVRSMQNPEHYGLEGNMDKDIIEHKLEKMCLVQIQDLQHAGLISRNPQNELDVETSSYGKLMAKYYLCFETMKLFRQIRGDETLLRIFELIVRCREFNEFTLRVNEKRLLNALNGTPLRFPRAGRIKTREDKISCLLQSELGNVPIASPTLAQESVKMIRIGDRIAKCLLEYMRLSEHQAHAFDLGRYKALLHTVTIAKCFHAKLWENSEYAAKQLQKIGAVYSAQLVYAGKTTLKSLEATDARTIEAILNKSYPFGDEILQNLQQAFPEYSLQLERDSQSMLHVCVRQVNEAFVCRGTNAMVIIGDSANQLLLFIEDLDSLLLEYGCFMKTIKLPNPDVEKIHAHVIHATLVGVDVHETLVLNEHPKESITTPKVKKCKKRKQQTGGVKTCNKRAKPNLSLSAICDATIDTTVTAKSNSLLNLQSFTFSKSKISSDTHEKGQQEHFIRNMGDKNLVELKNNTEIEAVSPKKCDNSSTLIQTKLTKYFTQTKVSTNKAVTGSTTSIQSKQSDIQFDKLKQNQDQSNIDRELTLKSSLRATTPDLHDISAFLETQNSRTHERTENVDVIETHNISTPMNSHATENEALNEILYSAHLETQNSGKSYEITKVFQTIETDKISTIFNAQVLGSENLNGLEISAFLEPQTSRATYPATQNVNEIVGPDYSEISGTQTLGRGISNSMQSKLANSRYFLSNEIKPLDLTKKIDLFHSQNQLDQGYFKSAGSTENFPISTVSAGKCNDEMCGLDLSRKTIDNFNMSWCDDTSPMSMSIAMSSKSSGSLKNSPRSIENFLLCYKIALAFTRLKNEERTIVRFKNIYKRMWHTNEAIDYITAKLSNSRISRGEEKKSMTEQRSLLTRRRRKDIFVGNPNKRTEVPLNLVQEIIGKNKAQSKVNGISIAAAKTAQLLQPKCVRISKGGTTVKKVSQSTRPETSTTFRNPFRLQISNDTNNKLTTAKQINNEVMNLVLDMKCRAIDNPEKIHPLEFVDYKAIERELELKESQDLPTMSFEEYCSYILQSPTKE